MPSGKPAPTVDVIACANCGDFVPRTRKAVVRDVRFCSTACKKAAYLRERAPVTRTCARCGGNFQSPGNLARVMCSPECARAAARMSMGMSSLG